MILDALSGVIDVAAAGGAAGLLALGGTVAARNRRPGPVRIRGRLVRHSRLVATWMLLTGVWGVLATAKRAGLPVSGPLLIILIVPCLGLLALLLVRGQRDQSRREPAAAPGSDVTA